MVLSSLWKAAFDTIDHAKLANTLSDWYGISGQSQISIKKQYALKVYLPDKVTLSYAAPRGSVILYTTSLSVMISSFDIKHHFYADDTQI